MVLVPIVEQKSIYKSFINVLSILPFFSYTEIFSCNQFVLFSSFIKSSYSIIELQF